MTANNKSNNDAHEVDTLRIPRTLAALERYWMQHQDKSLGQIILEFSPDIDQSLSLVTDEKFLENLNKVQWN